MTDPKLPDLPEAAYELRGGYYYTPGSVAGKAFKPAYTAAQMRAYALAALASDTGERVAVEDLVAQWRRRGRQVVSTWPDDLRAYRYIEQCADELTAALRAQPAGGGWFCPACDESVPSHHVTFNETHDERAGGCGKDVVGSGDALTQPQPVEGAATGEWLRRVHSTPPESGGQAFDFVDIANRAQAATGRGVMPSTARAVIEAAGITHPPAQASGAVTEAMVEAAVKTFHVNWEGGGRVSDESLRACMKAILSQGGGK